MVDILHLKLTLCLSVCLSGMMNKMNWLETLKRDLWVYIVQFLYVHCVKLITNNIVLLIFVKKELLLFISIVSVVYISLTSRVFANGPGDHGSILSRVIPKTQKMVLDAASLNTQHYMVKIKGKEVSSRESSRALPYTSVWWLLKRGPSGHPRLRSPTTLYGLTYPRVFCSNDESADNESQIKISTAWKVIMKI